MVNREMSQVIYDDLEVSILEHSSKDTAQEVINAAWIKFDLPNPNYSYPEFTTKDGLDWLTQDEDGHICTQPFDAEYWIDNHVIYYTDPKLFMKLNVKKGSS